MLLAQDWERSHKQETDDSRSVEFFTSVQTHWNRSLGVETLSDTWVLGSVVDYAIGKDLMSAQLGGKLRATLGYVLDERSARRIYPN